MSLVFHWFLPTSGDGRAIMGRGHSLPPAGGGRPGRGPATGAPAQQRPPDIEYLAQVARSAEQLGLHRRCSPRPAPGARTRGWSPRR